MNNSIDQKFEDLDQGDQKIAFDTLMKDQSINYSLVMNAACDDANDKLAAERVIDNVINTVSKRQKKAPAHPHVTPTQTNRATTSSPHKSAAKKKNSFQYR